MGGESIAWRRHEEGDRREVQELRGDGHLPVLQEEAGGRCRCGEEALPLVQVVAQVPGVPWLRGTAREVSLTPAPDLHFIAYTPRSTRFTSFISLSRRPRIIAKFGLLVL
jgi:hypothetical protein